MTEGGRERSKVTGGCACGEVRFGFYEPTLYSGACHCRACQYASGGGPAYVVGVQKAQFRVTRGRPSEFVSLSEAGHLVTRCFCATCGTQLYSWSEHTPEVCAVKVGALDDPCGFRPRLHMWTSEAPPWHRKFALALRFRRNPPVRTSPGKAPRQTAQRAPPDNGS